MARRHVDYMPLSSLKVAARNPKKHSPAIGHSIEDHGFVEYFILDERTERLVAGHGRRKALLKLKEEGSPPPDGVELDPATGDWLVPVGRGWASKNDLDADTYLLSSNQSLLAGGWEKLELAQMVKELHPHTDLARIGFSAPELGELLERVNQAGGSDPDAVPPTPTVAITKPGQMWQLGRHRIICGDACDPKVLARLFKGDKKLAALMATDPPYGVAYGETGASGDRYEPIANDEADGPKLQAFLTAAFKAAAKYLAPTAAWYVWYASAMQRWLEGATDAAGLLFHRQIIWVKPSLILGRGDFHWRHEPCFYGWRRGQRAPWYGDRKQTTVWYGTMVHTTVWEIGREKDGIHPTQKPVEVFARAMRLSSLPGEIVFEPFSGSGSQIVAAEQNDRACRAVELEPKYVDVAVTRWENLTGKKAVLVPR